MIGVPNEHWGEAVQGIVCARDGSNISEAELIGYCRERIASFKVSKRVDVTFEPLPKTSTGKLAKAALRARYTASKTAPV
ncbi:MAG TPA: hypothetical protein VIJ64_06375 [Candidatus Lustribacter sp.]